MALVKVKDNESLCRDTSSGAIIHTNATEYAEHKAKRDRILAEKLELKSQKEEINNIKQEMSEIKELLKLVLKKIGE